MIGDNGFDTKFDSKIDSENEEEQEDELEKQEPVEFVDLINYPNYEILDQYPFTIRKKDNHYVVKEYNFNGYVKVPLNGRKKMKHRIIAEQFIPNPNNLPQIDLKK